SATTLSPRDRSRCATAPMTSPVAPVRKTRMSGILAVAAMPPPRSCGEDAMNIAIIGAGNVGGALATSSMRAGHKVTIAAKDPAHAEAKAKDAGARAARSNAEAIRDAEIVILAVPADAVDAVVAEIADPLA